MDDAYYTLRDYWTIPDDIKIRFLQKVRPELICSACDAVTPQGLKDVHCHVYCKQCVKVFTDDMNNFTCHVCNWRGSRKEMETNQEEWELLEKMESVCPNEKTACRFSGPLKAVLDHYACCDGKGKAPCSLCGQLLRIKALPQHMSTECRKRIVECTFCNTDVAYCDKRAHETNCGDRPGRCEHCGVQVKTHKKLEEEHYPMCHKMPLRCEFDALGCPYQGPRCEMRLHMSQSRHDALFVQAICNLRKENEDLRKVIREKLTTLERNYEEKVKWLESKVADLQDQASIECDRRETLENSLDKMQRGIQALEGAQQTSSQLVEEHISVTENSIKRLDRELHLNPMLPGFEYVWKIQPFFALKTAAMAKNEEISSGVVYINKPGYAVEFIVGFPRASSPRSAPNLSFKCRIHAGEFDDMLPWPFKNKVILVLFNQQDERCSRSFELDQETPQPIDECFKKPASGQPNAKFGFSEVVPIPLLENTKKGFLLRNCVVLKIVVP